MSISGNQANKGQSKVRLETLEDIMLAAKNGDTTINLANVSKDVWKQASALRSGKQDSVFDELFVPFKKISTVSLPHWLEDKQFSQVINKMNDVALIDLSGCKNLTGESLKKLLSLSPTLSDRSNRTVNLQGCNEEAVTSLLESLSPQNEGMNFVVDEKLSEKVDFVPKDLQDKIKIAANQNTPSPSPSLVVVKPMPLLPGDQAQVL